MTSLKSNVLTKLPIPKGTTAPQSYSYSRMSTYTQCSHMYKMQYKVRPDDVDTNSIYTVVGSYVHEAIEAYYQSPEAGKPGHYSHPHQALLDNWKKQLKHLKCEKLFQDLQELARDQAHLDLRCTAKYTGPDAIRTKTGSVASNPAMTTGYQKAAADLKLNERKARIDGVARASHSDWATISMSEAFALSSAILSNYEHPRVIASVEHIEFPISDKMYWAANPDGSQMLDTKGNPVLTSGRNGPHPVWADSATGAPHLDHIVNPVYLPNGKLFNGYIDLVGKDAKGRTILADHKTSQKLPSGCDVKRHQQLLLYAWAWHELTGEWPVLIAISHLRSGQFVTAEITPAYIQSTVERHLSIIDAIEKEVFILHDPHGFGAPCIDYRSGKPACAYFKHCHPEEYREMTEVPAEEFSIF